MHKSTQNRLQYQRYTYFFRIGKSPPLKITQIFSIQRITKQYKSAIIFSAARICRNPNEKTDGERSIHPKQTASIARSCGSTGSTSTN